MFLKFVPPPALLETKWQELLQDEGYLQWEFEEERLLLKSSDGTELEGSWSITDGILRVRAPHKQRTVIYATAYSDEVVKHENRVLELKDEATISLTPPATRTLTWFGSAGYSTSGAGSREWYYYWNLLVPETGQATTVQGEILRVTHRMAAMYGNSLGGNWLEHPETYGAYADTIVTVLCDGTLAPEATVWVRHTINQLRRCCTERGTDLISAWEVDRLPDVALDWCRLHPEPIPRPHDDRMAF